MRQLITCSLIGLLIIAVHNFQRFSDRSSVSAFKLVFILKLDETQARRQRGAMPPPDFRFCPSIFFLPPTRYFFLGGRSWCFLAEKTLKFEILARRPFFVVWRSPTFGRKICDFGQKKPSDFGEDLFFCFWSENL